MTRTDWWLGVVLLVAALLAHAAFPRYEWTHQQGGTGSALAMIRLDRWTGRTATIYPTSLITADHYPLSATR